MRIENQGSFDKALQQGVNLFTGAGFSTLAKDIKDRYLPTGMELKDELIKVFHLENLKSLPLDKLYMYIEHRKRDELLDYIKERFTVNSYDDKYKSLFNISISNIISTNVDDLVVKLFKEHDYLYINDMGLRGPILKDKKGINYLPVHGSVNHFDDRYLFNPLDLASSLNLNSHNWEYLRVILKSSPTIFLGYGLNDPGSLQSVNDSVLANNPNTEIWYVLYGSDSALEEYYKTLGFNIIIGSTEDVLEYFDSIEIRKASIYSNGINVSQLFPSNLVPKPDDVVAKPVQEFFKGGSPDWYYVYYSNLHRTKYYNKIKNLLDQNHNIMVIGIAASGKSTVLLQLAAHYATNKTKLVFHRMNEDQALLLRKHIGDREVLVFIDNISDSVDAFDILLRCNNVQVVGFERDYNYDIVSHLLDETVFDSIDITDLDRLDIDKLLQSIPQEFRRKKYNKPKIETDLPPSLFEVIENNIQEPKLTRRYRNVLNQMYKNDVRIHNIVVVAAYVHRCRVPLTSDMIYAFLSDDIDNYVDMYELLDVLESYIFEYSEELLDVDDNLDYYIPRSKIISEAILKQVESNRLGDIITKFHECIQPFRIPDYHIFKRYAFDGRLMSYAFRDASKGKRFYEKIYDREKSPYVLQQGAIYLADKRKYIEAFAWIDMALTMTRKPIFAIRNTHAILLFKANIKKDYSNPTVRDSLARSMRILSECYTSDKRQTYHAITFTQQAIDYYELYKTKESKSYLEIAVGWLEEEKRERPWDRRIKRLYNMANRRLSYS